MNLQIAGSILLASISLIGSTTTSYSVYPATVTPVIEQPLKLDLSTSTPQMTTMSVEEIKNALNAISSQKRVSSSTMLAIVNCESNFQNIQSNLYQNGVREDSWGIVQINLPNNPDITKAQALDPIFSLNFLADKLSKGKGRLWSCYKILGLNT